MKPLRYILIIISILISRIALGQNIYCSQTISVGTNYNQCTIKYHNGRIEKNSITPGYNFQVNPNSKLFYTDLSKIYTFSFSDSKPRVYYKPKIDNSKRWPQDEQCILSFDIAPSGNMYWDVVNETFHYDRDQCKLFKLSNGKETQILMPNGMNFINFSISPNENKIAFVNTFENKETDINYLMIYDFRTQQIDTVDNDYNFDYYIDRQIAKWSENNIMYLKKGRIYSYDLNSKVKRLIDIPYSKEIEDFVKIGTDYYFIDLKGLYVWNGNNIKELYKPGKLDFLNCLRTEQKKE